MQSAPGISLSPLKVEDVPNGHYLEEPTNKILYKFSFIPMHKYLLFGIAHTHTQHFRVSGYLFYEALLERIKRFAFKSLISPSHCQQTFQNIWDFRAQVMRLWSCISCAERCIILVEKLHQFSVGLLGILNAMCKL